MREEFVAQGTGMMCSLIFLLVLSGIWAGKAAPVIAVTRSAPPKKTCGMLPGGNLSSQP